MWPELGRLLPRFRNAVLTGLDADGYPFSVRCLPTLDPAAGVIRVDPGPGWRGAVGPASLLCHQHDQRLWNQQSFLVRGRLEREAEAWSLRPLQLIPGAGVGGLKGLLAFIFGSRRAAARYLASRGMPRPRVPWADVEAIKAEVERAELLEHSP